MRRLAFHRESLCLAAKKGTMTYLKVTKLLLIIFGGLMVVGFAIPILSTIFVFNFSEIIGCSLSAAGPSECMFLGIDIGNRLYGYTIPIVGSLLAPVTFVMSFWDIIIIWSLCYFLLSKTQKSR